MITYTTMRCEPHVFRLDPEHHPARPNEVVGYGWDVVVKAECSGRSSTARTVLTLSREASILIAQDLASANLEQMIPMNRVQLIAANGQLLIPNSAISDALQREWADGDDVLLLRRYDAGDCDTIPWPNPDKGDLENLRAALYDAREMGQIPGDTTSVLLPDGSEFTID